jgi:hypothetical protein
LHFPSAAFERNESITELLSLEDPMLFASPRAKGFSGSAWMRKSEWQAPVFGELPEPVFLGFAEAQSVLPKSPTHEPRAAAIPSLSHPAPRAMLAGEGGSVPEGSAGNSRVIATGFQSVQLAEPLKAPVQLFNDVVTPTVLEVVVAPDGLVVSARVQEMSGSKQADSDALSIARGARFRRLDKDFTPGSGRLEIGKLIFEWHALDLSQTNAVKR